MSNISMFVLKAQNQLIFLRFVHYKLLSVMNRRSWHAIHLLVVYCKILCLLSMVAHEQPTIGQNYLHNHDPQNPPWHCFEAYDDNKHMNEYNESCISNAMQKYMWFWMCKNLPFINHF
jgi:hypothetical protein